MSDGTIPTLSNINCPGKRLSPVQVAELIRQGKLPTMYSNCVQQFNPIALVNGAYSCVSEVAQSYCSDCPMFSTRTETITYNPHKPSQVTLAKNIPTIDPDIENRFVFESQVVTIKNPDGTDRQWVMTIPAKKAREYGLQHGDKVWSEIWKKKAP